MSAFKKIQANFSNHIRDPDSNPLPENIEDRRMGIYRELFFNNVNSFVSSAFPVLKTLFSENEWIKLIRHFFVNHNSHTPLFLEISKEFLSYLEKRLQTDAAFNADVPEFIFELAHYEWVELDISVKPEEKNLQRLNEIKEQDLLVFSEVAILLCYLYPVHQISIDFQPKTPSNEPTFLVVYRDADDDVQFLAINALTAHLLNCLQENPAISFNQYLKKVVESLPELPEETIRSGATTTINRMAQLGIIRDAVI